MAERELTGRSTPESLTARTGYAGGNDKKGLHCYHNSRGIRDYGQKGDTEVVQVTIPVSQVPAFAKKMMSKKVGESGMFGPTGDRLDVQDRGSEYRSALGLPGGVSSTHFGDFDDAAK